MVYNVSGVQQRDTFIYIYMNIYIIFQILFYYWLLQGIVYSSLCYTVGPVVYFIHGSVSVNPKFPIYLSFPFSNHTFVFYVCGSISVL